MPGAWHRYRVGVHCPSCQADDTKVVDSRLAEEGAAVRRRRQCLSCSYRFTTFERVEEVPLVVVKSDGSTQPFDRDKIASACAPPRRARSVTRGADRAAGARGRGRGAPGGWRGQLEPDRARRARPAAPARRGRLPALRLASTRTSTAPPTSRASSSCSSKLSSATPSDGHAVCRSPLPIAHPAAEHELLVVDEQVGELEAGVDGRRAMRDPRAVAARRAAARS